jgi:uncharacterized membrane protein YsdA (DUF1294 family)/cold shock CspA family protein
MRFEGLIKSWNDERGFGFIAPAQGGQEIFVHIKSFTQRNGRPQVGQRVSFELAPDADGRKRAHAVQPVRAAKARPARRQPGAAQWGTASYFAIPAFLLLYLAAAVLWRVPAWVGGLYGAASVACMLAYAFDKSAAAAGRWRVSEATLLCLGLAGGWPGAIVAQQLLRHKSSKASFRSAFWATVVLNVAGFALLASPWGTGILGA